MIIKITMPTCHRPRLIDIRVSEGDEITLGDILFSYESDGALFFEYSAYRGTIIGIHAAPAQSVKGGDDIMTVDGEAPSGLEEMFSSR